MSEPTTPNSIEELKKVFSIACGTYGLNPHQLWHINKSLEVLNEIVFSYKKTDEAKYIENYNILAKLLNNVQTSGNVFNLEDAGKVFSSLNVVKKFLETQEITDDLDTSYDFIKHVINKCFFTNLIYTFDQIDKIVTSINVLSGIHLEIYKEINQLETLSFIREMIELGQNKGRFSLDQANSIILIMSDIKKNIIRFNVDKQKQLQQKLDEVDKTETKVKMSDENGNLLGSNEIVEEVVEEAKKGGSKKGPKKGASKGKGKKNDA
jgi:hypothetical protein